MTVSISKPAINLREKIAQIKPATAEAQEAFWFSGDGTETDFPLPTGWTPKFVYVAGALKRPTTDYAVNSEAVSFVAAPVNGADVGIVGVR